MNNAKMWLVVSPTVGVPLFLGAVAVGSFSVHMQVVKNTSWVSDFLQGVPMGTGDQMAAATLLDETNLEAATASFVMPTGDGLEVTVILPDGTSAQGILRMPETMAAHEAETLTPLIVQ
ncbi:light-harvesting protein [Yoonia sp. R2331]|uniref:light-harvesting protein n=1 Tax=Yoonia sp. R2331 TaxID=3237238 RepID=UPI0034E44317